MEYPVKQIWPNHADHISYYKDKYLEEMFENESVIAQPKYDGERMLIHIDGENVYCTSRRHSKKTDRFMENQDKLPILKEVCANKFDGYTVLDCECYADDWSTVVGILHSLPERAIELQKSTTVKFAVFDCLFYNGEDIREKPYVDRIVKVFDAVDIIKYAPLHTILFMNAGSKPAGADICTQVYSKHYCDMLMESAIMSGFEGIVVKSLDRKYYDKGASLKCKKFETVDCVVIGYQQGRGKYEDTIGALEIGYYDKEKDKFVQISRVNCGSDEERNLWRDNWNEWQYSVIEVKCQEVTDRSLRHPVYIRRRPDKVYSMCTKDTIFKEA